MLDHLYLDMHSAGLQINSSLQSIFRLKTAHFCLYYFMPVHPLLTGPNFTFDAIQRLCYLNEYFGQCDTYFHAKV